MSSGLTGETLEEKYSHLIKPVFDDSAITIVYAFDDKYCKFYAVALKSLIDHSTNDRNYDIVVLETDISQKNKTLLSEMIPSNFSIRFFNISDIVKEAFDSVNLMVRSYWNDSVYYKCFIPLLMRDYRKALFMDADVAYNDSIDGLFDTDFEDKPMIVTIDCASHIMDESDKKRSEMLHKGGVEDTRRYFNTGMVYYNIERIDPKWYYDSMIYNLMNKELWYPDQDLLNFMFWNNVKVVSCRYDYQIVLGTYYFDHIEDKNYVEDYKAARENPAMIHYTGAEKPWLNRYWPYADLFWRYAKETPYFEELDTTDFIAMKKKASDRLVSKLMMMFLKHVPQDSWLFRVTERIIWPFAWKV